MKILLTGGNDVLQHSISEACVTGGHTVRVIATNPHAATMAWPAQVEPVVVSGHDDPAFRHAAHDCEAAVAISPALAAPHEAGPRGATIERALEAAGRAGIHRLVLVTTLDDRTADLTNHPPRGTDGAPIDWLVLRTAPLYGVGNDPVTLFLIMMRSLPAMPLLPHTGIMQPVWHEDLATAVAGGLSLPPAEINRALTIVGPDAVTQDELYDRVASLIDRRPVRIPLPAFIAAFGLRLADAMRLPFPAAAWRLAFAHATHAVVDEEMRPLRSVLGSVSTGLDRGLRRLVHQLAEVRSEEGVGTLEEKHFSAVIQGSRYDAEALLALVRARFAEVMPVEVGVEPVAPGAELTPEAVLTIALPGRGHVSIRVVDVQPRQVVVATLRGHVVAGTVRFSTQPAGNGVRFEVRTSDRAANVADWVSLTLGGARAQDANWTTVVKNVVELSGGQAAGVDVDARRLSDDEAEVVERRVTMLSTASR